MTRIIDPLETERPAPAANGGPAQTNPDGDKVATPDGPAQRRPFTVWKPSDFLAYVPPAGMDFLQDGLLRRGELCLLAGQGGLGKSRLSLWLACCQITGREWCGLGTAGEPATWLFVGNENSVLRWKTDLEAMRANFTDAEWATLEDRLRLLAMVEPEDGVMVLTDSCDRLARTLDEIRPGVLVLDPWAAFIPGNENDSHDTRDAVAWLLRIVRGHAPDAALLVVAHARTGREHARRAADGFEAGGFIRGSKVLYSIARAQLNLAPGSADDSSRLVLAWGKGNNGPRFEPRGVRLNPQTFAYEPDPEFDLREWRDAVDGGTKGDKANAADVWHAVNDGCRQAKDIAAHLEAEWQTPRRTAERLIQAAVSNGYIETVTPRGSYALGPKRPPGVATAPAVGDV